MLAKAKQILQEKSIELFLIGLTGAFGLLLAILWKEISVPFLEKVLPEVSKRALLASVSILFLLFFITLIILIIYIRENRSKLTPHFGILWDKKENPYCPSCKNLLTNYGNYGFGDIPHHGFHCVTCNKNVYLTTDDGAPISLANAKQSLRSI